MWTLMKWEMKGALLLSGAPLILVAIVVVSIVSAATLGREPAPRGLPGYLVAGFGVVLFALPFCAAYAGVGQMFNDRRHGVSRFLSTLATSRGRIAVARVLAGVAYHVVVFGPLVVTYAAILERLEYPVSGVGRLVVPAFVVAVLLSFCCYAVGLWLGGRGGVVVPWFGTGLLAAALIALVVIKGLSAEAGLLLVLVTVAALAGAWVRFRDGAL